MENHEISPLLINTLKGYVVKPLSLLLVIFLCGLCHQLKAREKNVNVILDTYPPYSNQLADNSGVLAELVKKAFEIQNINSTIAFQLWNEIEEGLASGQFLTVFWKTDRVLRRELFFSTPILFVNNQLVSTKPITRTYRNLGQLKDRKIGITNGFSYGRTFDVFKPDLTITSYDSRFTGLRALINGEIDFYLVDPLVAKQLMVTYFNYRTKKTLYYLDAIKFEAQPAYLACSKNYANCQGLLSQFERGLQHLKDNKEYKKILSF